MMPFIKTICDLYQLGQLKQATLWPGSQRLWRVEAERGCYAVKQIFSDDLQGEQIAQAFAKHNIPAVIAILRGNHLITEIAGQTFLVFNWQAGKVLSADAAAPDYAYRMGYLLAQLHLTQLNLPDISISRWQNFQTDNAQIFSTLSNLPAKFFYWLKQYFIAQKSLTGSLVISHGDLLQANVIWDHPDSPHIIDWEAAGWIHPQIELIGVLLNWSGINVGQLNHTSFNSILQGYQAAGGKINIDETILWASLGSWFAWLAYNTHQLISAEKNTEKEITNTLAVLQAFTDAFPILLDWIRIK